MNLLQYVVDINSISFLPFTILSSIRKISKNNVTFWFLPNHAEFQMKRNLKYNLRDIVNKYIFRPDVVK